MSTKALKTQLMAAIAMTLVAAVALGSSTFAWFAANASVRADGIQVTTQATGSLVIQNATEGLPTSSTLTTLVSKTGPSPTILKPSTHDSDWTTFPAGLKYNNNAGAVSAETGLAANAENPLAYAAVTAEGGYYVDYSVYIASIVQGLTSQDLTVYLNKDTAGLTDLPGAYSIDFYYCYVRNTETRPAAGDSTYAGTLNLAKINPATTDGTGSKPSFVIQNINIPEAVDDGNNIDRAVCVLMRIYVDGALKDSETTTFVKTRDVSEISNQTLAVTFENAAHVTPGP